MSVVFDAIDRWPISFSQSAKLIDAAGRASLALMVSVDDLADLLQVLGESGMKLRVYKNTDGSVAGIFFIRTNPDGTQTEVNIKGEQTPVENK